MSTKHTKGPWMVVMQRNQFGDTVFGVLEHTHTLVVVDPEGYYAEGQYPARDEDGYYLPDDQIDCSEHKVATARLIAAAPELLEACQTFAEWLRREDDGFDHSTHNRETPEGEVAWREWFYEKIALCSLAQKQALAVIAKATGATHD